MGKIHGGKGDGKARQIIALHPDASEYEKHVEAFGGLASVKMNLAPRDTAAERPRIDIYNDADARLPQMFKMLRDEPEEMVRLLQATPKCEHDFRECLSRKSWKRAKPTEQARRTLVMYGQSFSGRNEDFARSNNRTRRDMASEVSAWLSRKTNVVPEIIRIIETWEIQDLDGFDCINTHDQKAGADGTQEHPRVMFYLDPPYLHSTRAPGALQVYREFEMSEDQHISLLGLLQTVVGKVLISGYDSELYRQYLAAPAWRMVSWEVRNQTTGPGIERPIVTECCWMNYPVPKPLPEGMTEVY